MEAAGNWICWALFAVGSVCAIMFVGIMIKRKKNAKGADAPDIRPMIKYFKGQCNSFRLVAVKPRSMENCEKVFRYADKVFEFHAEDDLKKWWNDFADDRNHWDLTIYRRKAEELLSLLQDYGVTPSTEKTVRWNDDTPKYYIPFEDIGNGDVCNVIQPYWMYDDDIFEQGLVSKK